LNKIINLHLNICSKQWDDAENWDDIFYKQLNYFNRSAMSNKKFACFLGIEAFS